MTKGVEQDVRTGNALSSLVDGLLSSGKVEGLDSSSGNLLNSQNELSKKRKKKSEDLQ